MPERFHRYLFQPCLPLGKDGKKATMCQEHLDLARQAAAEGAVLLKNDKNTLPLAQGEKIALFGIATVDYIKGGTGSGDVYTAYLRSNLDGLKIKEQEGKVQIYQPLAEFYRDFLEKERARLEPLRWAEVREMEKMPYGFARSREDSRIRLKYKVGEPELTDSQIVSAAAFAGTAMISLSRISGEDWDRIPRPGDYYLSEAEKTLIDRVTAAFSKVIVVLNVGGVIDTKWLAENRKIGAALLTWQGGTEGGLAAADILCGDVNPSGKLTDTFASSFDDYPSSAGFDAHVEYVDYNEDIYVGYRYFETIPGAKEKVIYPFGFGLSYTSFALSGLHAFCDGDAITVTATVENTGRVPGKEVVQVYYAAPQGVLGKPAKALIAFQKTKLLAPGERQTLAMTFPVNDMASYDDLGKLQKSAYLLEQGAYRFYVGTSVADVTELAYAYEVNEAYRVTQQLVSRCYPVALEERMLSDGSMEKLPVGGTVNRECPVHTPLTAQPPREALHLNQVGIQITPEEFVAQMTDGELAELLGGKGNVGVSNTCTFGGNDRLKIPRFATADGPAGLRLGWECGIPTTAWPVGTLLACTWDTELVYKVGEAGAKEVKENNLAIWLTPALNIHRNPLCGRNFEYYSEDPYVSGKMASAMVKGIQSQKVGTSVKHFAANNKELNRTVSDSRVSERALREIYLKGFEICVKEARPWTVMTSYNVLNGIHTSESVDLTEGILRQEWGFDGIVTTDWGVKNDPVLEVRVGSDMKMPNGYPEELLEALQNGTLTRADLEVCALRLVNTFLKFE